MHESEVLVCNPVHQGESEGYGVWQKTLCICLIQEDQFNDTINMFQEEGNDVSTAQNI